MIIGPIRHVSAAPLYATIHNEAGQVWDRVALAFIPATAVALDFTDKFRIEMTEGPTNNWTATFPAEIPLDQNYGITIWENATTDLSDIANIVEEGVVAVSGEVEVSEESRNLIAAKTWSFENRKLTAAQSSTVTFPSQRYASRALIAGDTYGINDRPFLVDASTGGDFPVVLSDYSWELVMTKRTSNTNASAPASITGTVDIVTDTGASRSLSVNISGANTVDALGDYDYSVKGTHTVTAAVWTPEKGIATFSPA